MLERIKGWSKKKKIIVGVIAFFIVGALITPGNDTDTASKNDQEPAKTEEAAPAPKPEKKKIEDMNDEEVTQAINAAQTPQEKFDIAGKYVYGENYLSTTISGGDVTVDYKMKDGLTVKMMRLGFMTGCKNLLKITKGVPYDQIHFGAKATFTDAYGNNSEDYAMKLNIPKSEVDKINFDNFDAQNLANIGDLWMHPAMLK